MEFNLSVAELHYASVTVDADSLAEAVDKVHRPHRYNDGMVHWADTEFCCTLLPSVEHPWNDIDDNYRDIQCKNEQ